MAIPSGSIAVHPGGALGSNGINRLKSTALTLPAAGRFRVTVGVAGVVGAVVTLVSCGPGTEPPEGAFVVQPAITEAPTIKITVMIIQPKRDIVLSCISSHLNQGIMLESDVQEYINAEII
jgi:hypothetical protein